MLCEEYFKSPENIQAVRERIGALARKTGPVKIMEICGTHTMAIAKSGIRSLLPEEVSLISGPGCPVCVTPAGMIDAVLELAERPGVVLSCYGDMLRIPGSDPGETLLKKKASGCSVQPVYSPIEAVRTAEEHPDKEVVFLGVGFETTAPGTAACMDEAAARGLTNFSVLSLLKRTEPAIRALADAPDFSVDGFLCPGHVAAVTGAEAFSFLPDEYRLPAVISGFEAGDILYSLLELMEMLADGRAELKNEYTRIVRADGNTAAKELVEKVFCHGGSEWRGLGNLPDSGYAIRGSYRSFDAREKFPFQEKAGAEPHGCRCAQIIRGASAPEDCPLFGGACTPENPAGPCMVSGEGSCAAAYRYGRDT